MEEIRPSQGAIRFGAFEVDLRARELRKQGVKVKLQDQPFQILRILLERPGEIVTREELQHQIWPADTFVDFEHGLYNAIKRLREALNDSAETPRYIETLPRRGYRFLGTVNGHSAVAPVETPLIKPASGQLWTRFRGVAIAAVSVLAVSALLLGFNVGGARDRLLGRSPSPRIQSLAVLPLVNLSGDSAQDYFADGMTEELITDLSQFSALKVISRTSIMRYKKSDKSLQEIARELNVDGVVEGSVVRSGDRVRVTAQLIYAPKDTNLWAQSYERDVKDALVLQSVVARAIAGEIAIKTTPQEQARLRAVRPVNSKALEAYLRGQYHSGRSSNLAMRRETMKQSEEEYQKALAYFGQAIQEDPNYVPAYLGLAEASLGYPPRLDQVPKAEAAIEKALTLDETNAKAHLQMAKFQAQYKWNWTAAENEYKRALELNPNSAESHDAYADLLDNMGRQEERRREHELTHMLDPDGMWGDEPGLTSSERVERMRAWMENHPSVLYDHWIFANLLYEAGEYPEAVKEWQVAGNGMGWTRQAEAVGRAFAKSGQRGAVKAMAKGWEEISKQGPEWPVERAQIYVYLGDYDHAIALLEKSCNEHGATVLTLRADRRWAPLHSDARFQALVRHVGLPPVTGLPP